MRAQAHKKFKLYLNPADFDRFGTVILAMLRVLSALRIGGLIVSIRRPITKYICNQALEFVPPVTVQVFVSQKSVLKQGR